MENKVFYVWSAARSGSTSLTSYMSYAKNARIFHEPVGGMAPYLRGVVENQRLGKPFTPQELFEGFRKEAIDAVLDTGKMWGELSPMLGYVAEGMVEAYPGMKGVWLLRNPKSWVRSAMHNNFRDGSFRQCCLMWYDLMMHIHKGYEKLDRNRRCIIKIEDIDQRMLYELYCWLDLEPQHDGAAGWMAQSFREHKYRGPIWAPHPDDWGDEEVSTYESVIEPLMQNILQLHEVERLGD